METVEEREEYHHLHHLGECDMFMDGCLYMCIYMWIWVLDYF